MSTETERRDSDAKKRNGGSEGAVAAAVANLPIQLGAAASNEGTYEELETPTAKDGGAQGRRLPHLRDYNIYVSWVVYVGMFSLSAVRQGLCNYLTASGIADEDNVALAACVKVFSTCAYILGGYWISFMVIGERWRSKLVLLTTLLASIIYGVVYAIQPAAAALTILPTLYVATAIMLIWSPRRRFTIVFVVATSLLQVVVLFIIQSLPAVQSKLPEVAQQFLVPALKTFYLGSASEVLTLVWKKMYSRPCSPYPLTGILLLSLVTAETMGVVGLLAAVDSDNIWTNAAIFCATTIVMETNSRSGILVSFVFKLMGKKYRFTDAGHIVRWAKMWASYCWVCVLTAFVVPALILGLRVENSNFTFLRWELWVLVGIYVVQQMATDFIYVYIQHYIRPSPTLSQTAARCLVLGEATPLFGENEHIGDDGGMQSPKSPKGEEFESVDFKVGRWTITVDALMMFLLFEFTVGAWNNYVRGQFCVYGTLLPSDNGKCDD